MKVVQINAVYEYSSTGRTVKELHLALKKTGYQSYVFCTNESDEANGVYCMGTPLSRNIHGFLSRLSGLQGYFSYAATKRMLHKFDEIQPDVVHLRNLHGNYIHVNLLLDYLIARKIPTVVTLHDCWLFTGHCCHYIDRGCDRWKTGCGKCSSMHEWNKSWFFDTSAKVWKDRKERFSKLSSLTIVGVSDWITDECRESFMRLNPNVKFRRVYNWIDMDIFSPDDNRQPNERPIILSVSQSWSALKGLNDILKVANDNQDFDFYMIGQKPEIDNLPENVRFIGPISKIEDLVGYYRKADVLLHLSYQETFGKVVAESLSCGTPAVVYNVTALPELIGKGCGYVVEKGNWKQASFAVRELVASNNRIVPRKFAETTFDGKKLIRDAIDVMCCGNTAVTHDK